MPEAAVDEDDGFVFGKDEVGADEVNAEGGVRMNGFLDVWMNGTSRTSRTGGTSGNAARNPGRGDWEISRTMDENEEAVFASGLTAA